MIFRAIEIESWGTFASPVRVEGLSEGINVIHGPNETGKSTLAGAIARGLFDRRIVSGADASAMKPWDREVGPRVALEFAHGGAEYRFEKRFLVAPVARLERREGAAGRFTLVAEADEAEERVRSLLGARLPGKGMTKPEHWGIAQLLFARQGEIRPDGVTPDAEARLRRALGSLAESPEGDRIERRVEEEHRKLFTETGQLKKTALPNTLESRRQALGAEVQKLRQDWESLDELRRRLEDYGRRRARCAADRAETAERAARSRAALAEYRRVRGEADRLEAEVDAARLAHEDLDRRIEDLRELRLLREAASQRREKAEQSLPPRVQAAEAAAETLHAADRAATAARDARARIDAFVQDVADARAFDAASRSGDDLAARIARIEASSARLEAARRAASEWVAPDSKELAAIRKALAARDAARHDLEASRVVIEVEAEAPLAVAGGPKLAKGERHAARGTRSVEVRLLGVARVRAHGPAGGDGDLDAAYEKKRAAAADLTRAFGTDDAEALELRHAERVAREGRVREIEAELKALEDAGDRETLAQSLARARAERETVLSRRPEWRDGPPDIAALEAARKAAEREHRKREEETEAALAVARKEERLAEEALKDTRQSLADALRDLDEFARREAAARDDGLDDAARVTRHKESALAWHAARAALEAAKKALEAFAEDPLKAVERAERELDKIDDEEARARHDEVAAQAVLAERSRAGAYSQLAEKEEALAACEADLARERLRAEALKRLFESLRGEREQMISELLSPVRSRVERNLRRIAGPRHAGVRFGASGLPEAIRPSGASGDVGLETLSGGTEEQLFFVTRLALAQCLASGSREAVILDDPLVNSDADRIERALAILEEAAQSLQILLFTCHPGAYRGLAGAKVIDLGALRGA